MCTVIVAVRAWPGVPLVVAANRDERLDRPAEPPAIRAHAGRRLLAPLDKQAGGTWLALGETGVFAAVTNRYDPKFFGRVAPISRGTIVLDAAVADDADTARAGAAAIDPDRVNPFHLLVADRSRAFVVWSDGEAIHEHELTPGLHVITERSFGAADPVRERELAARLADVRMAGGPPPMQRWVAELSRHESDPLAGTCVHADAFGYGTRASTYLSLGARREGDVLFHADGRPCTTALRDLASLLHALG